MKCPKCAYQRHPIDEAPAWRCPSCKVAYMDALQAREAAKAAWQRTTAAARQAAQTVAPAPDDAEVEAEQRLWQAAKGQNILIHSIVLNVFVGGIARMPSMPLLLQLVLFACVALYALGGVVRIGSGLNLSQGQKIGCMVVAFIPILNLLGLLYLNAKATALLRDGGWTVGLLGARP